ncbi:MAG: hypothetical protein ICV81_05365 [Flavisolibacter sp.]|nr:hypothetical protein [Flavisolibacter sp.]MBD0285510.1 hypothetical protein [Flavisolibacter sp.]MBD0297607.1 hypothetical protein [Flavisolibacter sp.]
MKREQNFFGRLFNAKAQPTEMGKPTPVTITSYSQPHVLQQRMKEEKMTHGETVTANLSPVRLEKAYGKMILYFCPMQTIEVLQTIEPGDGGRLPAEAKIEGLSVPTELEAGHYTLRNVIITSNGTMQVRATEQTAWERVSV